MRKRKFLFFANFIITRYLPKNVALIHTGENLLFITSTHRRLILIANDSSYYVAYIRYDPAKRWKEMKFEKCILKKNT